MKIEEVIGARIADVRETNGISQQALGEQLGEVLERPWPRQTVSNAEKGHRAFAAGELLAIAYTLGVPVHRLLTPPHNVRDVEMPNGKRVDRDAILRATMPRFTAEKVFGSALTALGTLASASHARLHAEEGEADALQSLYDHLTLAAESYATEREQEDQ